MDLQLKWGLFRVFPEFFGLNYSLEKMEAVYYTGSQK